MHGTLQDKCPFTEQATGRAAGTSVPGAGHIEQKNEYEEEENEAKRSIIPCRSSNFRVEGRTSNNIRRSRSC